jgi:hypothetical protein
MDHVPLKPSFAFAGVIAFEGQNIAEPQVSQAFSRSRADQGGPSVPATDPHTGIRNIV